MDDRTTIAKELFVGWVLDCWRDNKSPTSADVDDYIPRVVANADKLCAELARTAKPTPQPAPAPARGVPVWRKMDEKPPSNTNVTVLPVGGEPTIDRITAYMDEAGEWRMTMGDNHLAVLDDYRWLDLNGYTPEVGE